MATTAYVNGQAQRLTPAMAIGQGGEAVIYRVKNGDALKLYLQPDDPLLANDAAAQVAARQRLDEQQHKLAAFPRGLPASVIAPNALAYGQAGGGRVTGYTMPFTAGEVLMNYSDRRFRDQQTIDQNGVVGIYRQLHQVVSAVHRAGVVIGDFNDLNVLVKAHQEPFLVDADSMQFGQYLCRTFTARFVDPLQCAPDQLLLTRPHSQDSDWYAYGTMLFQSLLLLSPYYGGVHRPKAGRPLRGDARVLQRLTVLSPEVVYPKSAIPLAALPDDVLDYFSALYHQDRRGVFPARLLDSLRWTSCSQCGMWHARAICPSCAAPGRVQQVVTRRGTVTASRLFRTQGRILFATHQGGELRYVYHEAGAYKREHDRTIAAAPLDGEVRVRIGGPRTLLAKSNRLLVFDADGMQTAYAVETVGKLPILDASSNHYYWVDQGRLLRDGKLSPVTIGSVLSGQTLVWSGGHFGFGFYRAGSLTRGFVFGQTAGSLNDNVALPVLRGNLLDASCVFDAHQAWFMVAIEEGGVIKRHCFVVQDSGQVTAAITAADGDGSWLDSGIRGQLPMGGQLYVATDNGIVRVSSDPGLPVVSSFPDTEPFVAAGTTLLPGKGGIVAVNARDIILLQIS